MPSLFLCVNGSGDNWSTPVWTKLFEDTLQGIPVVAWPSEPLEPDTVKYAVVWQAPQGLLRGFRNLEAIFNLGAGVDALLGDETLPDVPVVRVVTDDLTKRMTEYVVLHVLMHHRRQPMLMQAQADCQWMAKDQWAASDVRVGIMGLGELGRDAAEVLLRLGFQVAGWSRSAKSLAGVACYAGAAALPEFLARTDILVVLLPLSADTRGILDRELFRQLARDGRLGGPVLINAGRGGLQVERDILDCLDDGTLHAASLDVFEKEPLPGDHPLWRHPRVLVTPHNAADSDPNAITAYIVDQIQAYEAGKPLRNVVDRKRGY